MVDVGAEVIDAGATGVTCASGSGWVVGAKKKSSEEFPVLICQKAGL